MPDMFTYIELMEWFQTFLPITITVLFPNSN